MEEVENKKINQKQQTNPQKKEKIIMRARRIFSRISLLNIYQSNHINDADQLRIKIAIG